jgi:pimeloyl-ACP methyl ester carboxylesterase
MKNIIFIHGMFQNPKSWEKWTNYFSSKGYNCISPAWPFHEGDPTQLRENPSGELGDLRLDEVAEKMEVLALGLDQPIVIGHSVGGLIVQLLLNRGVAGAGVAISSVAPNAMLDFDWDFFKNAATITNPLKGDEPIYMDEKTFHDAFANTLSEEASNNAFTEFAVHDSRNVLRDCMGSAGQLDLEKAHAPLLFIGGEKDHIVPPSLNEKNAKAYTEASGITAFKEFPNRSHYICGEPGWQEVAAYTFEWLQTQEEHVFTH